MKEIKKEIIVKSQEQLDSISQEYTGTIIVDFGTDKERACIHKLYENPIKIINNSFASVYNNAFVIAEDESYVSAWQESTVLANDNSIVQAFNNSIIQAFNSATVFSFDSTIVRAHDNSSIIATNDSKVTLFDDSSVEADINTHITANDFSFVKATGNAQVNVNGESVVEGCDSVTIIATGMTDIEAKDDCFVLIKQQNIISADDLLKSWDNCEGFPRVKASGNVRVKKCWGTSPYVELSDNAQIINDFKDIYEFMNFHKIKYNDGKAIFYKAVRKIDGRYVSDYDEKFQYKIGEVAEESDINTDRGETCAKGIHISNLDWALFFGKGWYNLAILEVETDIDDIIFPYDTDGKVRTSKVKVLREIPLEECGRYGKIVANRLKKLNLIFLKK